MSTNVPAIVWDKDAGPLLPQESAILAGVRSDQNAAFGYPLNPALETPQGQLASSLSAVVSDCYSQWAYLVNQIDPATSEGIMQDAIGRIYYIERDPAKATSVQCLCIGVAGTPIPVGAQVSDGSGGVYSCVQGGTISGSGNVTLQFQNDVYGPLPCPAGTINRIHKMIPGWDAVSNTADGVLGNDVEGRAAFEERRALSVALNAQGSTESIYAAVLNVPGIVDAYVVENTSHLPVFYGATNYSLLPNSIYVAAVGGNADEIAQAIYVKKGTGCNYNGNTLVNVADNSRYELPYPSYEVRLNIPTTTPILFSVSIANNPALPANVVALVKAAIINAFAGGDGGQRARIGSTIYALRYISPVRAVDENIEVLSLGIGITMATQNFLRLGIDQAPAVSAATINVALV
ncbi:MAG: baseplate J/gp47 family protein [Candidatus Paceibacterota bacterium]|jgi:uncharacterized phage protein gp47/JayE